MFLPNYIFIHHVCSERELDNIVGMGDAVMEALRGQRQKMERSSGSLESIAASLGISQSIVRNIQRTEWIDAKIGVLVVLSPTSVSKC